MTLLHKLALDLDKQDKLSIFRDEFYFPEDSPIYLDGNSLGLLSKRAEASLLASLEDWKRYAIDGWTNGENPWFYYGEKLSGLKAPLIGASPKEIATAGSITSNLHQLISTLYQPEGTKTKILTDNLAFPTDIYVLESQMKLKGVNPADNLMKVVSSDGQTLNEDRIIEKMTEDICLILLPSVLYRSGQLLDLNKLTKAAHERNIIIGFDLAHSIGVVPHQLHETGCDFAVWCTYKYLNSGPGGVGGLFLHEKHHGTEPGLTGWFGSDKSKQFDMSHTFTPADDASAFQLGTPHILNCAPLQGSLEMFQEAGIATIREKSLRMTAFMRKLFSELKLLDDRIEFITPEEDHRRGGHLALSHPDAARICKDLKTRGVIPDFRAPHFIRFAPAPLYTSFTDVWETYQVLKSILESKSYERFSNERNVIA
ncbi:kynureninase [Salipaludibacillus keqinensis]|uniref:Kynureninase n=1 Tax=Salipaludibacillus keqinensis TaxID=2045207 RepID=A0A323TC04_9BACI|nr:kynureninase [Salipaludibacillus keqinensis]PYZ92340.1 kynureninase [Salipaludibacillus keqinensis]